MESQPQNPEFRNNPETFIHVTVFKIFIWGGISSDIRLKI